MDLEFTPEMLADPEIMKIANMLLVNIVDTSSSSDNSIYSLKPSKQKLLKKSTVNSLLGIGTRFSGTMHFYAEVDIAFLDEPVPDTFKHSKKTGEDGETIGTRSWRKQSLFKEGKNGTAIIRSVNKIGSCGDPKGMSHEDFILFAGTFPNFLTYSEKLEWDALNIDTTFEG